MGLELVASEIVKLPDVETRQYVPGERLGGDTPERLKRLHIYIRDGAIGLRVAAGRLTPALLEVFGPGRLLPPWLWDPTPALESPYATALAPGRPYTSSCPGSSGAACRNETTSSRTVWSPVTVT